MPTLRLTRSPADGFTHTVAVLVAPLYLARTNPAKLRPHIPVGTAERTPPRFLVFAAVTKSY